MPKKYLTVLCDGMADYPDERGLTPMDEAYKPFMDKLCAKGISGLVQTVPDGMKPGSDVCNLAALGYDPRACYTGRSPLEALSMGIKLDEKDVTFRVNLVTLSEEPQISDKTMLDYSAGEISTAEASELISTLRPTFEEYGLELYAGISYRHTAVLRGRGNTYTNCTPPHDIIGKKIGGHLPDGGISGLLNELINRSIDILKNHPINANRISQGKNPAAAVWFWGEGTKPSLGGFYDKFGKTATIISAVDLVKGIGRAGGFIVPDIPTATGTVDTDYAAKTRAAVQALQNGDYCFVHLEGPDECGHQGDRAGKILAIERIDEQIIKPLLDHLNTCGNPFAISVMPDHATPLAVRTHTAEAIPFMIYDSENEKNGKLKFCEKSAAETGLFLSEGKQVIERLFK